MLWDVSPAMALVMSSTCPTGDASIVELRNSILALSPYSNFPEDIPLQIPTVRHVRGEFHKFPSPLIYVGFGETDIQHRPSPWANPYFFISSDPEEASILFKSYLDNRADILQFLSPLRGAQLVCDCCLGPFCHADILCDYVEMVFGGDQNQHIEDRFDAMSEACVLQGFDDDMDSDPDSPSEPRFDPNVEIINETVRSGAARLHEERPAWLPSWVRLIMTIRCAVAPVFWEIFSGKAGLTRAFIQEGWPCGPPIDILYNPEFDVLNPLFFAVILGLIFERLIRVLHLGPPCSSFSMAVNRFPVYAMRDAKHPEGFGNLPPHRRIKVQLGNALAEIAERLAQAQVKAGNYWMLEQPATSLMWLYKPIAKLIAGDGVYIVVTDVCMFGAPWRKPTSIAGNFPGLLKLRRRCNGQHKHITLQGTAPCGKSWTAVASPYWPEFVRVWVRCCASLFCAIAQKLPPLIFAGFASVGPDASVEEVLNGMSFPAKSGNDNATTALRVSAGLQPAGRAMPQLLPDGLGPSDHITVALATPHPLSRPPSVPSWCKLAFDTQSRGVANIKLLRRNMLELLEKLATLCWPQSAAIAAACHRWIRPTVEKRNVAFMRELIFVCPNVDSNLMVDFVFGLPMLGWARHSPVMLQRVFEQANSKRPTSGEILEENKIALERAKPSKNSNVDALAWEKTKGEFVNRTMVGPFYSLDELPCDDLSSDTPPRLLNRFGILEMHGGATQESCRVIDDGKARGHNANSGNTATHRPADLDLVASLARTSVELFPSRPLSGFPSDFKGAYRQVPADPAQARDFVVASWDFESQRQVFFMAVTQLFGSGNAPLNFTRFPDFCCRVIAMLLAIPAVHCVDDVIVVEILELISSSYYCWRSFARMCGWDVPDAKSPPPSQWFRALGAILDFTGFPSYPMYIRPAQDRLESLKVLLGQVLIERRLSPSLAGKLYGKLMFMSSQYFGRLGRALLRAFSRRQHENIHVLNNQIEAACNFWISSMESLRPREIPVSLSSKPVYLSYSDGEGEGAGVGIALWCPCGKVVGGYIALPLDVRQTWSRAATAGDHFDIFEIEAVGPALILHNWGHLFESNALWLHFIDNESALATLVKGSSSVLSGECITAYTHAMVANLGLWPWFDRVSSADNPVDKLSRGENKGPWELVNIEFPPELLLTLRKYVNR